MYAGEFGTRVKNLRGEKGLTQDDLADKLGVTKNAVSLWERGLREPPLGKTAVIADLLDTSVDYLLSRTDNRYNNVFNGTCKTTKVEVPIEYPYKLTPDEVDMLLRIIGDDYDPDTIIKLIRKNNLKL